MLPHIPSVNIFGEAVGAVPTTSIWSAPPILAPGTCTRWNRKDAEMRTYSRALVTGGAGFIGSRLCAEFLAGGVEVVALDDLSNSDETSVPPGVELIRGSVTDPGAVRKAVRGADLVLHLAARIGTRESASDFLRDAETNVTGTLNVLASCAHAGVRRLIYPSTAAVYAEGAPGVPMAESHELRPTSPYGISKLAAEMYVSRICAASGIEHQVLRFFNAYGPGQKEGPYAGVITLFANLALAGKPPVVFGDGKQVRDFVHVDDIVTAAMLAAESEGSGHVLNIGTGTPCTVNRLAALIGEEAGSTLEPVHAPAAGQEIRYSLADTRRAEQLLGLPRGRASRTASARPSPGSSP